MSKPPVVIVTGAGAGMGRATAKVLAAAGYVVEGCDAVAAAGVAHVDVRDDAAVRRWVESVVRERGAVDAVVTFAGRALVGAFEETSDEEAAELFDVNVLGAARVVRAVLPGMREREQGRVVLVSSGAALVAQPFCAWYSATKAAVEKLAEALRMEARPFGVEVTTLMPGWTRTRIIETSPRTAATISAYAPARGEVERRSGEFLASGQESEAVAGEVLRLLSAPNAPAVLRVGKDVRSSFWARRLIPVKLYERMVRQYYGVDSVAAPPTALRLLPEDAVVVSDGGLRLYQDAKGEAYEGRELANEKVRFAYRIYSKAYPLVATLVFWIVWNGNLKVLSRFYSDQFRAAARRGELLVEVGVGDGSLTQFAWRGAKLDQTPPLLFVDLSPDMLEKAAKRLRKTPDAMFLVADVNAAAIPRGSVRWLSCFGALHVFLEPGKVLRRMAELLEADGEMSLSVLVRPDEPWKAKLVDRFVKTNLITSNFTADEVAALFADAGLEIVEHIRNGHQLLLRAKRAAA